MGRRLRVTIDNEIFHEAISDEGLTHEVTSRPWRRVSFEGVVAGGNFVRTRIRCSLLARLERPLARIETDAGPTYYTLPAPLFGISEWIIHIENPNTEIAVSYSAVDHTLALAIDECEHLSKFDLVNLAFKVGRIPAIFKAFAAIGAKTSNERSRAALDIGSHPLNRYDAWRSRRGREPDLIGIDKPKYASSADMKICYVCVGESHANHLLKRTLDSLRNQVCGNWSLIVLSDADTVIDAPLVRRASPRLPARALLRSNVDATILAPIEAGSIVPSYATAAIAEYAAAFPHCAVFYADDDEVDCNGRYSHPKLKPDWSPTFHQSSKYVGKAIFLRASEINLAEVAARDLVDFNFIHRIFMRPGVGVEHIRRVLLSNRRLKSSPQTMMREKTSSPSQSDHAQGSQKEVAIIIPTKDKAKLLGACLTGIGRTKNIPFEIVLVDNGSKERETFALYETLAEDKRLRIISSPGPFNFSKLCNEGARHSSAPILLFLNNDIEAIGEDWMNLLLHWARDATVGAVGARLLYPSGQLQHGGMVLGLRGAAGHVEIGSSRQARGYLDRLAHPHEVSAVTGACLAVDRQKFDAVGGFDAQYFPIELNDVDLCLRLRSKGWRTIVVPQAQLIHHESATRGKTKNARTAYPAEHRAFLDRWGALLNDDPYYHPALSLASVRPYLA